LRGWTLKYTTPGNQLIPQESYYKYKTRDPNGTGYFLLRVRSFPYDPNVPLTRYLEITSVGRTLENPGIFKVLTAYKPIGITDYAINVTQYDAASQGFKPNVTALGKPPAIEYDADAVLGTSVAAGDTTIQVPNPQIFSEGDEVLIGRDPNVNGLGPLPLLPSKVGIRERVVVNTVNLTTGMITVESLPRTMPPTPVLFNHEQGEPMVIGRVNGAGVFERKVTIGRLVRSVDVTTENQLVVTSVRHSPSRLVQNGDMVYVGFNNQAMNKTEHALDVTNVDGMVSPPFLEFTMLPGMGTNNPLHEKGEPVHIYVSSLGSPMNPYEQATSAAISDSTQETEFAQTVIRGPVFSNADLRFYGNVALQSIQFGAATLLPTIESARSLTYDVRDNPITPVPEGADSTGTPVGHPSSALVRVGGMTVGVSDSNGGGITLFGGTQIGADGVGRLNGDFTQPRRQVRQQRPPVFALEGLPSNGYVGANTFAAGIANNHRVLRYEELTRHSDPRRPNAASPTFGEMGYGKGVFIDNYDDVQFANAFLTDSPTLRYAKRRQAMIDQWLYKPIGQWANLPVAGYNDPSRDSDGTSQWVNPVSDTTSTATMNVFKSLEYVPKGVQIILRNDDVVWNGTGFVSMRQANLNAHPSTGAPHVQGKPVIWVIRSDKQPLDTAGNPVPVWTTDARTQRPLFFTSFDYPENGVIFAPGNVRVKGNLPVSYRALDANGLPAPAGTVIPNEYNLTIVSGGTIYVEGSILRPSDYIPALPLGDASNTHVALLAKDHVCLNTTQFYAPFAVGTGLTGFFDPSELASTPPQTYDTSRFSSSWRIQAGTGLPVSRQFSIGAPYLLTGNNATTARLSVALRHGGTRKPGVTVQPNPNNDRAPNAADLYMTN
jgi:hypothetical protein